MNWKLVIGAERPISNLVQEFLVLLGHRVNAGSDADEGIAANIALLVTVTLTMCVILGGAVFVLLKWTP
jgi:hypothetical protein